MRRVLFQSVTLLLLLLSSCSDPSRNAVPEEPSTQSQPEQPIQERADDEGDEPQGDETDEPPPPANEAACAALREETHAILQTSSASCQSDADCACYPAFIDCGGVRDTASAALLAEINERRIAAGCDYRDMRGYVFNCAPWECSPRCNEGTCMR